MSRHNYGRQYFSQPQQVSYSNGDLPDTTFTSYNQPYLYDHSYDYYGIPYTPSANIHTSHSYWCNGGLGFDCSTVAAPSSVVTSSFPATHSIFSPDAPEFVSRQSQQIATGVENTVLQPSSKKKKKRKKKPVSTYIEPSNSVCSGDEEKNKSVLSNPIEKKSHVPMKLENSKLTRIKELPEDKKHLGVKSSQVSTKIQSPNYVKPGSCKESPSREVKHLELKYPQILPKSKSLKEPKSVRFQESAIDDQKLEVKNPQILTKSESAVGNSWSKPLANSTKSQDCYKRPPKMSFADKLKSPVPIKSPFLDWRDQRTNAANSPIKYNPNLIVSTEEKVAIRPPIPVAADEASEEVGFTTVSRKKPKKKEIEKVPEETVNPSPTKLSVPAEDAKKKLERERKKLREKQKKKQVREEKLLAEKLAPKGQKVTIITPKLMEQFLKSGRNVSAFSKPVMKLSDDMFPALGKRAGKGNVSESESEWETTEIEVVQKEPAGPPRNVKRSDPIEFDLMALIAKKSTKKKTISDQTKKGKIRPGIVANVLDRSAPTLSRGKIRNKKRKLSEIRKALLVAKAKKKIARESQVPAIPSSEARLHVLHSKKFREYCDQILTDQIDLLARDMLYHLRMFQDRVFKKDPIKARMKKRLIAGLREVTKQVERNRVKIIFLAPDIQRCPETGGLDEAVKRLLDAARRLDLPIVYALSRRKLGRVLFKKVPVSCCGILNYQATEETWKQLTEAVTLARENYQLKLKELGLAVDIPGKETKIEDSANIDKIAAFSVEKKVNQTDTLLELMKLSLKDKP